MRHVVYSMGLRSMISSDNPLGRTKWNLKSILHDVESGSLPKSITGITLQRFCGALTSGRHVGERIDGSPVTGMMVGSFDDYLPSATDISCMEKLKAMGYDLITYVGFPLSINGIMEVFDWNFDLSDLAIDMSGTNKAGAIFSRLPFLPEPYPRGSLRPSWLDPRSSFTMFGYHNRWNVPPAGTGYRQHIMFTGDIDHANGYDATQADGVEGVGFIPNIPRQFV